ncbi:hypothetical protein Ahy_B07g086260 [Arachis hypogaea]|uniref:Aminotransferase-like plant mobile domain-containing protein n=1 Tax=Arachis hypogaea TaxID=3818 RepID=A0A444Y9L7_ARAHY|nr:hypothetical protein Ahy_B07g086260 [Arachis hypogaea]
MRGHSALLSALAKWRLETHIFHLLVGKVTVTLEDVTYILGLPVNGDPVTGRSDSSHQFLVENCIACFSREPGPQDHVLGKMFETVVIPNKSTTSLNSKFLPLLRDFHWILIYSWGAASLAHLYRSLCCASRFNCKEMDGPLILLFV